MIDWLAKQLGELLIVENLQTTAWRDFAYGSWVEVMMIITITTLHEYTAVTETLGKYFPTNVIQVNTCKNVQTMIRLIWYNDTIE